MRLLRYILAAMVFTASAGPSLAEQDPVYTDRFTNVAVEGFDPVAYFAQGEPVKGSKGFSTTYQGAEFRFSSQANLDAFLAMPADYAPQYGGYCSWAVSQGYTAKGDAQHWKIVDGKLYLNYNRSVQEKWEQDIEGFIESAEGNWPTLLED
jgi:YHS domain-containing protein